jgi:hypothetical protein
MLSITPFEKTCTTPFGRFRVKVTPTNISVGGSIYCVNIAIKPSEILLHWLSTESGGCSLDHKIIHGTDTIRMVDLAFSLLQQYFPSRHIVTLFDGSSINIKDVHGKNIKLYLLPAYFFLYGKTWYEDKFGATILYPNIHITYRQLVENNYNNPDKKPAVFDYFGSANDELQPLYQSSSTWREFAENIKLRYPGPEKYKMISEWYRRAVSIILDGMELNHDWQIDIHLRPFHPCITLEGGGKRNTRRRYKIRKMYPVEQYIESHEI